MLDLNGTGLIMTEEEKDIVAMVHEFVLKEVRPKAAEYDRTGELDWDAYNKAFEMGLICADLPAEYGGQGMSAVTGAWIREELMYGDAGFGLTCGTNNLGIKPVLIAGTEEQKRWCVETLMSDKPGRDPRWPKKRSGFASFALTEPDAGSDAGACRTTAEKTADGSEYILNGRKCFITNACYADFMCVVASVDRSLGYKGLTMFLVDAHLPGVSIGKHEDKMGIRQSATCDVIFEDVHIPASAIIGKEGEGFKIAMKTLEQGRAGVGSGCVGIMRAILEEAAKYSQVRVTMGKPICAWDIDILNAEGKSCAVGENGEIVVRTADGAPHGLFLGYYRDEARTKEVWHDGYYHTGDVAWRDEDGYFWYVGRADDVIKSSGYRIGPFEIESVIMELPYVLECGVSAAPDEIRGQVVKASIVLTKGTEGTEALKKEIQNYVKERTAPYKYPRIVVFRDELPKTISGKIQRNKL